jgi:hypothetical protein
VLFVSDQSAQRRSANKHQVLNLFRSRGSRTALLQVRTCSLCCVVTFFSDGEERRGFIQLSSRINMQCSRVLDSVQGNTFNKTISIHWKPTFLNATFGTAVCSCFIASFPLLPSAFYFLPSHSTRDWCRPQPPILLKNTTADYTEKYSFYAWIIRVIPSNKTQTYICGQNKGGFISLF